MSACIFLTMQCAIICYTYSGGDVYSTVNENFSHNGVHVRGHGGRYAVHAISNLILYLYNVIV